MAKSEVITLRISEDVKEKLNKVFKGGTTSEIVRNAINSYVEEVTKAEKGIVPIYLPVNLLKGEDLDNLYIDITELEDKVTNKVVESGYDYDLDYLKALQNAKNFLISHMCIENGSKKDKNRVADLQEKIRNKSKKKK